MKNVVKCRNYFWGILPLYKHTMKSRATVHLEPEGMITAKIETPEETYHIEPSWRHITDSDPETMIAYK